MADDEKEKPFGDRAKLLAKAVKGAKKKSTDDNVDSDTDGQDDKAQKPTVNPKLYVKINPPMPGPDRGEVNESTRSMSQINYLINHGIIGDDLKHISGYRQAMSDPKHAVTNPTTRAYVADVLDNVLDMIFGDSMLYNRVRFLLQKKHGIKVEEAIRAKAEKSGFDMDTLMNVYIRGLDEQNNQEKAFNRVNSFIAGGNARKLDCDLLKNDSHSISLIKQALKRK
jgi:hypothetical protein